MALSNILSSIAAEKLEKKKLGKKGAAAEERSETPAQRKAELPPAFLKRKGK